MTHIKLPVNVVFSSGKEILYDAEGYLAEVHVEPGYGPGVGEEIANALNVHPSLVKQRDALWDAAEASEALSKHIAVCDAFNVPDGKCETCLELGAKMRQTRRDALALVREDADG